jgi:hypothetical protein
MDSATNSRNQGTLEEFLEDLLLHSNRPEQIDLLLEVLRDVQQSNKQSIQAQGLQSVPQDESGGRFDVFKISEDGILRIGFVRGIDNAKKILPGLNSARTGAYFLYDTSSSKIIDFFERAPDQQNRRIA